MCIFSSAKYVCSYDGLKFKTMDLLLAHVKKVHTAKFLSIKVNWTME
jgi:hypothetical protein